MLTAVPKSWFSWDFWLREPVGNAVAELHLSFCRERGSVVVGGTTYRTYRKSLRGPFVMEAPDGTLVGSATKPHALRREFTVVCGERSYVLKAMFAFRRKCGVFSGEQRIGLIEPASWVCRRANAQFTDDVSPPLQAFLVWLTLLLWKRDSDSASS